MSVPTASTSLLEWGQVFGHQIDTVPAYGIAAPLIAAYDAAYSAYASAQQAVITARSQGVRGGPLYRNRDQAKADLLPIARELYAFVQASTAVSDALKQAAGVVIPDREPTRRDPPGYAPVLGVQSVTNNVVRITVRDAERPDSTAKPPTARGANVFVFSGDVPPPPGPGWAYQGCMTRFVENIILPISDTPQTVWISAAWVTERGEMSPACPPQSVNLPAMIGVPVAVKLAA